MNNLKRARGYYLYSQNGDRYLDIGLGCGQFVLGRKQGKSQLCFKDTLEKGLTSYSDSVWLNRCKKAIVEFINFGLANSEKKQTFSDYEFLPVLSQSIFLLNSFLKESLAKEVFLQNDAESLCSFPFALPVWRPWLGFSNFDNSLPSINESGENKVFPQVFVVINPLPFKESPVLLAVNKKVMSTNSLLTVESFLKSTNMFPSSPFLAGTTRAIYDFISIYSSYDEKQMSRFDSVVLKYWNRKGPWLFPKMQKSEYEEFKNLCQIKKILISEKFEQPSFIPQQIDGGELRALRNL